MAGLNNVAPASTAQPQMTVRSPGMANLQVFQAGPKAPPYEYTYTGSGGSSASQFAEPSNSSAHMTAPYPGRAASLPGTSAHSSHHGNNVRGKQGHTNPTVFNGSVGGPVPYLTGAARGSGNPQMAPDNYANMPLPVGNGTQIRAQLAQQFANGNFPHTLFNHGVQPQFHQPVQPSISYERYTAELTNCIIAFLSPILPTEEEYRIKEATRRQLERLAGKVSPGAKLLAFGSMANGFALRNSDMDLCCLMGRKGSQEGETGAYTSPAPTASELVEKLAKVIREETDFNVLPLPKARIPIIKISRASTSELPYEISCDIGFENRLALENTRLLLSYAMVDPPRLRTLVLFLKVWTKRRKLNSPYMGTLSSYGYTLLVLYYLCHVKRPAVLPNLQRIPPTRPLAPEEIELNGNNIYFYDDMATLRKEWQSQNTENVAELLIDFFRYFAKDFAYSRDAISLRTETGLIPKDGITWNAELCIEDPFQSGYNVSRTVTKDGLYTIRGEFMRATRVLQNRNQRVSAQLAELCEEREDIVARAPDTPPARNKYVSNASSLHPYADARTMRELYYENNLRRSSNTQPSGFGGSFAFEEMARGLGRQRGQLAYPSAAMLAPLSHNGGLSPRVTPKTLRELGARTGQHGSPSGSMSQSGTSMLPTSSINAGPRHMQNVGSSARSEDGGVSLAVSHTVAAVDDGMPINNTSGKRRMVHASARTSPTFAPAVPHGVDDSHAVGEAWAFGSEIVFGSERFRLHPHPSRQSSLSQHRDVQRRRASDRDQPSTTARAVSVDEQPPNVGREASDERNEAKFKAVQGKDASLVATVTGREQSKGHNRASRSFSDGVNRSKSLPRASARNMHVANPAGLSSPNGGDAVPNGRYNSPMPAHELTASLTGLAMYDSPSGRQSPVAGSDANSLAETETSSATAPMREYTAAWAQNQLNHRHESGGQEDNDDDDDDDDEEEDSPNVDPDRTVQQLKPDAEYSQEARQRQRRSLLSERSSVPSRPNDSDSDSLSDGVLDELSRVSEMESQ